MDFVETVKELRSIADAMSSSDRSNKSLGAVYDSIMELSYKLQDHFDKQDEAEIVAWLDVAPDASEAVSAWDKENTQ
tara:strand:- start:246 stop:476 length:231 start_codon:yes stop_codon:yes gene_type:complete